MWPLTKRRAGIHCPGAPPSATKRFVDESLASHPASTSHLGLLRFLVSVRCPIHLHVSDFLLCSGAVLLRGCFPADHPRFVLLMPHAWDYDAQ